MRTHKQQAEIAKRATYRTTCDGYKTSYEDVNNINLHAAWEQATNIDKGLPLQPSGDDPEELERAIISLARRIAQLEKEWC